MVQTSDPGNAGTIVRLADAAGADAVIFAGDSVDAFDPKAVRASPGSSSTCRWSGGRADGPVAALSGAGLSVLATTGAADLDLDAAAATASSTCRTAWLFGSEAHGLPAGTRRGGRGLRVPIHGRAESLNLATAAAICLYASATAQRRPS